ncbi:membrane protein [Nocardioides daphniae]|uniref:Membrane protein n=2 Tax=Nocardioides daphniae TaxID=402297 RepID=A0ABQ1QJX5_9ACTN|nr:membrane protein [Nocardioides daphniae]
MEGMTDTATHRRETPISIVTPEPAADAARRRGLRIMRTVAVGLLVLAAVVYVATLGRDGFWGYVNAGAEASMVGAIADWFAVTALFRHPLGLPIPHTALVPKRKDELGRGLEEFVGENFLQEEIIRDRVAASTISLRIGEWLHDEAHARRVVDEASEVAAIALGKVRDEHVVDFVTQALVPRFREEPVAPLAGSLLTEVVDDGVHHGLVDLGVVELHRWLLDNPETFARVLSERAPWWTPPRLNEVVTAKLHTEALKWLEDIRDDPRHHAREAFDSMLEQLAKDLLHDEATQARAEAMKERLLDHPQVTSTVVSLWNALRRATLTSLRDPSGALRERAVVELLNLGATLRSDATLRERLDRMAADAAVFVVARYGAEVTTVITHTIERWDGREAAEKIELHVGRDLQFIRINGTVVGGFVGLLIHAVSQALGH